jgi:putative transposase
MPLGICGASKMMSLFSAADNCRGPESAPPCRNSRARTEGVNLRKLLEFGSPR